MSAESNKPVSCTRATARRATSSTAFRGEPLDPDDPLLAFRPVPHLAPRRNSITPARQRAFIAHLAACGIVTQAARHIGASLEALYRLRHKAGGEEFSAAWDRAVDRGIARIEDGALARAIEGVERPIVSQGKLLGWYRVHNETLVMFFLRTRRARRYGAEEQLTFKPGHPVYERIKAEVLKQDEEDEAAALADIDAWLEGMRERRLTNEALLLEMDPKGDGADEDEPGARDAD